MNIAYVVWLEGNPDSSRIWELTGAGPNCHHHLAINELLCERYFWCGSQALLTLTEQCKLDVVVYGMPAAWDATAADSLHATLTNIAECHRRGIPVATMLEDIPGGFLNASVEIIPLYMEVMDAADAILAHHEDLLKTLPLITKTPAYPWHDASSVVIQTKDSVYPYDAKKTLITLPSVYARRQGASRGVFQAYLLSRALLEEFPSYQLAFAGTGERRDIGEWDDPLLDTLGLRRYVHDIPTTPRDWPEYIDILRRSKLVIHMDMLYVRGGFLIEGAALGACPITTNISQAARLLGVGVGSPMCLTDAVEVGRRLLSDEAMWRRESMRVFHIAKSVGLDQARWTFERIILEYGK